MTVSSLARLDRSTAIVPSLWWFEVRNSLLMAERRGRTTSEDVVSFLNSLDRMPIRVDRTPDSWGV